METVHDVPRGQLSAVLEHDQREIDAPIEAFAGTVDGLPDRGALAGRSGGRPSTRWSTCSRPRPPMSP